MDTKELLKFCLEKGLLLDKEVLTLLNEVSDVESAKLVIEKIRNETGKKILTKSVFYDNKDKTNKFFLDLPAENQKKLEKLKIKLGLSIEISKESQNIKTQIKTPKEKHLFLEEPQIKIVSMDFPKGKKLEVGDFVTYFKNRYVEIKNILQESSTLTDLISIDKVYGGRKTFSIIGMVFDKKITKNGNILLDVEDVTGRIRVLINKDKRDLYEKAENIALDSVVGFKGFGNNEIIFANEVCFPEAFLNERKKSPIEEYALFGGDAHIGSKFFLEESFLKFIDYLNGKIPNTPEVSKIKYLVFSGDLVAGVGAYPNQEKELALMDLESQYERAAELLSKIRRDIKIILCAGNHDCVRIMEPQPILEEKYSWPIHNLKNVTLTTNPSMINIGSRENFSGFNVLMYHGFSYPYYAGTIPKLVKEKAIHKPELVMEFLLKNRHLAPTHASVQYFPAEKDTHFIRTSPDIFVSGHIHKSGVAYFNNILNISSTCWEGLLSYQEKRGIKPDFCKVPMFNLKTRAIKILDFEMD
ncbi:MAG: metallophosphoesterase [Candidatus Nanoarchaeia archaeon]